MEIDVKPEDINRIVADAVAKSAIGQHVRSAVEKALNDLAKSYQNPYDEAIKSIVTAEVRRVVEQEFGTAIREKAAQRVRDSLTDTVLAGIAEKAVNAAVNAIDRRY